MATVLDPAQYLDSLLCPSCSSGAELVMAGQSVRCSRCSAVFPVTNGILEFVIPSDLDQDKRRELQGNNLDLTPDTIAHFANKEAWWSQYYSHVSDKKLRTVSQYIARTGSAQVASLGSGTGYELKWLLGRCRIDRIFSSDLSFSTTSIVPQALAGFDVALALFTSDLDRCPVRDTDILILVYEALHHTPDMHAALEKLLRAGFRHVVFCEPSNNWLIRWLARRGLAQRVEYSGVKPGRLDVRRLRRLCAEHAYDLEVKTMWHFPDDYFSRLFGEGARRRRLFLAAMDALSAATNPVRFGNVAVAYCRRRQQ